MLINEITHQYDWPDDIIQKTGFRWRGQNQRFYLVEYIGENNDFRFNKKEIRRLKWVSYDQLYKHIHHDNILFTNYYEVIHRVLIEFNKISK